MTDEGGTREELLNELAALRSRVAALEAADGTHGRPENEPVNSEAKYRAFFESTGEGILISTADGRIATANPAAAEMLGYENPEELVGMAAADLYSDPADRDRLMTRMLDNGSGADVEVVFLKKDGTPVVLLGAANIRLDREGKVAGAMAMFSDVTERKRMEEALRRKEEELRSVFASCPLAIVVIDLMGTITDCNASAVGLLGRRSREDLVGKSAFQFADTTDEQERIAANIQKTLEEGMLQGIEYDIVMADGRQVTLEVSANVLRNGDGEPVGFVGVAQDITRRKQAEKALRRERDRLEMATENIGAYLVVVSRDFKVVWLNRAMKERFGDIEGKTCYSAGRGYVDVCPDCGVRKIFEGASNGAVFAVHSTGKNGSLVRSHVLATPVLDREGNVIAAVEMIVAPGPEEELPGQLQVADVRRDMLEKLKELERVKTEFAELLGKGAPAVRTRGERWMSIDDAAVDVNPIEQV